ncbi:MAG TPA: AAA family ATPase [Chitinophagaceae bacterium]|nr:AAA family ATPase [Chitinophagaceae bacterium]
MEHIKNIEIKNFKSIRQQKIEGCRRINVFIGYPNVGKSNILEALGMHAVHQLKVENFIFNEICRVRNFSELFFNRDTRESVRVILNGINEAELLVDESNLLQVRLNFVSPEKRDTQFSAQVNSQFSLQILENKNVENTISIKKYEFKKDASLDKNRPRALSIPYGDNLWDVIYSNGGLRKDLADIFREYSLKVVFDTEEQLVLKFQKQMDDDIVVSIGYHQIADTLQRLIFHKAAVISNKNTVLLFEEPEAHMFPPYISKFTSDIIFDKQDNQYFISTHSPFVLNDLIEELDNDELSIYAVGYERESGETIIHRLTDEQLNEVYQYGVDLFFNLEDYLKHAIS